MSSLFFSLIIMNVVFLLLFDLKKWFIGGEFFFEKCSRVNFSFIQILKKSSFSIYIINFINIVFIAYIFFKNTLLVINVKTLRVIVENCLFHPVGNIWQQTMNFNPEIITVSLSFLFTHDFYHFVRYFVITHLLILLLLDFCFLFGYNHKHL